MGSIVARLRPGKNQPTTSSSQAGQELPKRRLKANAREYNAPFQYTSNFIKTSQYNIVTFVPKNLFNQFRRLANFYFLVLMILQLIPQISSLSPWTTILPLAFVLAFSAAKDAIDDILWPEISPYPAWSTALPLFVVLLFSAIKDAADDIQRHKSDKQLNNRRAQTVKNGQLVNIRWQDIAVGDIIKVNEDDHVPADLLILSTSEPNGLCYVETAELDGETNLKAKWSLADTDEELGHHLDKLGDFDGEVECERPNNNLNTFTGMLTWKDGNTYGLNIDNILLRGSVMRNSACCYGLVIFAGRETKLMMNSGKAAFKRTSIDKFLNVLIIGIVIFLVSMCLICTVLSGVWEWTTGQYFLDYLPWPNYAEGMTGDNGDRTGGAIAVIALLMFFSYAILLNTVVPISLYVSVEVIRFMHSWWINWDRDMYYAPTDTPANSRTTTLNEELGQVQYIFSDKTGTLTQNIMTFNKCSINGIPYGGEFGDDGESTFGRSTTPINFGARNKYAEADFKFYDEALLRDTQTSKEVQMFWRVLALCHTVMPDDKDGQLVYQAQSPDEAALTSAARNFGYVFRARSHNSITIEVNGRTEEYELLKILDFNNVRKRMSVIIRDLDTGNILLYCKGADTMVLSRLDSESSRLYDSTMAQLDKFAGEGLRTLCLAYRILDEKDYNDWVTRQHAASVALEDRDDKLNEVYDEIEKDMTLIGATAIEDKLQDGVPETIANLAAANIKIWVLTGDKQETAINIGYSSRLLTDHMVQVFVIDGMEKRDVETQLKHTKQQLDRYDQQRKEMAQLMMPHGSDRGHLMSSPIDGPGMMVQNGNQPPTTAASRLQADHRPQTASTSAGDYEDVPLDDVEDENDMEGEGFGLVVNGHSLVHALEADLEHLFLEVACRCTAVICCRVTPIQKAGVVDLVKKNKNAVTLAIGDGANDVSMIKAAHIGVGISGQEGMQAVMSSDFSLAQFRFLERLLLVHGRWSYYRMSKFLRYFFYKNFAFTLAHFWYAFFCGYSAMTIFDARLISVYNLVFTSQPVLALGIFDQDVDDKYSLRFPKLYIPGQYNLFFNMRIFIYSVLHGISTSMILFFIPYGVLRLAVGTTGHDLASYDILAFTIFTCLVVVVSGQIAIETSYWTFWNHFTIWGSLVVYFLFITITYELVPLIFPSSEAANVAFESMASTQFWLCLLLTNVLLLMPVLGIRFFWQDTHPDLSDRLRLRAHVPRSLRRGLAELPLKTLRRHSVTRRSRKGSLRSGYAFSHQQGFGELITMGKLFKRLEIGRSHRDLNRHRAVGGGGAAVVQPPSTGTTLSPVREQPPPGLVVAMSPIVAGLDDTNSNTTKQTTSTAPRSSRSGPIRQSALVDVDEPSPGSFDSKAIRM